MAFVIASEIGPMPPTEEYLGRWTQHLQNLPGEPLGEGIAEFPVARIEGLLRIVVQRFVTS